MENVSRKKALIRGEKPKVGIVIVRFLKEINFKMDYLLVYQPKKTYRQLPLEEFIRWIMSVFGRYIRYLGLIQQAITEGFADRLTALHC